MANQNIDRTYSETLAVLETTNPASASTFNPLFNRLINNDANLNDLIDEKEIKATNVDTAILGQVKTANGDGTFAYKESDGGGTDGNVPTGGIIMWSGSPEIVPIGWNLCDGTNGTPNLIDRFIMGAATDADVGNTGGASTVTLSESQMPSHDHIGETGTDSHSHTGDTDTDFHNHNGSTSTDGIHQHTINTEPSQTGSADNTDSASESGVSTTNTAGDHSHTFTTDMDTHSHALTTDLDFHSHLIAMAGSDNAHENKPPYYKLAYIMKL